MRKANKASILGGRSPDCGWIQSLFGVPRPPHRHPPAPTDEARFLNLAQTHTFHRRHMALKGFQARGRDTVAYLAQESTPGFSVRPRSSNSRSPAPSHTPEPGCSVPGSKPEGRGQRAPAPHPIPQPHTWLRWAGPRADQQRPDSGATYFSYSVLSRSQRESLCFCQSLPCLQVVRSTTSSPLWT